MLLARDAARFQKGFRKATLDNVALKGSVMR